MERPYLTPTSHPPWDVDYTRYSLYHYWWNWRHQQVRSEGPLALYKGFFPAFARMGPWNVIFFLVYEKLQNSYPYVGRWDHKHKPSLHRISPFNIHAFWASHSNYPIWRKVLNQNHLFQRAITARSGSLLDKILLPIKSCVLHSSTNSGLGSCWYHCSCDMLPPMLYISIIILLWSTISKLWLIVTFNLWNTPVIQQVCDQSSLFSFNLPRPRILLDHTLHSVMNHTIYVSEALQKLRLVNCLEGTVKWGVRLERHRIEQKWFVVGVK